MQTVLVTTQTQMLSTSQLFAGSINIFVETYLLAYKMSLRNYKIFLALFYYFHQFVFTDCVIGNMSDNSSDSVQDRHMYYICKYEILVGFNFPAIYT